MAIGSEALLRALLQPACYPHPVERVEVHETHISWVFLAGEFAYKVKKPVSFEFLDFSTLSSRGYYCAEELRLNRRLAPALYLEVVEIRASEEGPRIGGSGPLLEYALKMRRFPQESLAKALLARNALSAQLLTDFAGVLARFHTGLPPAPRDASFGTPESVLHHALQNFVQLSPLVTTAADRDALAPLRDWTNREFFAIYHELRERHDIGMVRECHGDLHLGNIVLVDGVLTPFDCIEFSAELRWNDPVSEVAFLTMDLLDRGATPLAWTFLNAYLEATGVYSSLAVLRFYLVYRALVRAKVHLLRAHQAPSGSQEAVRLVAAARGQIALARRCTVPCRRALVLMHGFSGSGKSAVADALVGALGAVRIRSDVERKRLQGLHPLAHSDSAPGQGLYRDDITDATYTRLREAARVVLAGGYPTIIDATFLRRDERRQAAQIARSLGVELALVDLHAPEGVLRHRLRTRQHDASEATLAVLERQLETAEPILPSERLPVLRIDTRRRAPAEIAAEVRRLLGDAGCAPPGVAGGSLAAAG